MAIKFGVDAIHLSLLIGFDDASYHLPAFAFTRGSLAP